MNIRRMNSTFSPPRFVVSNPEILRPGKSYRAMISAVEVIPGFNPTVTLVCGGPGEISDYPVRVRHFVL